MRLWFRRLLRRVLIVFLVLAVAFVVLRGKYRDVVRELAQTQVKNSTSDLTNDAIAKQIANGNIAYDRLVFFEKDLEGRITALKTNMSEVNRLKTDILDLINDEILALDSTDLGIPIGSLILPEVFSGRGFQIPVIICHFHYTIRANICQLPPLSTKTTKRIICFLLKKQNKYDIISHGLHIFKNSWRYIWQNTQDTYILIFTPPSFWLSERDSIKSNSKKHLRTVR